MHQSFANIKRKMWTNQIGKAFPKASLYSKIDFFHSHGSICEPFTHNIALCPIRGLGDTVFLK